MSEQTSGKQRIRKHQKGFGLPGAGRNSSATRFVLGDEQKKMGLFISYLKVSHATIEAGERKNN